MTNQYLRKSSLIVGPGQGVGLELKDLHYTFQVEAADNESPNSAFFRVYNLSDDTANKILKPEFTRIVFQAGYENGNYGTVFDGQMRQKKRGRENATDTYFDIMAQEADEVLNFAVTNKTLAAGSTPAQRIEEISKTITTDFISQGYTKEQTGGILPRGKVMFGMSRDLARFTANSNNLTMSVQDGKINWTPLTGYLPGPVTILNSKTGLIGIPEQTNNGVKALCLLNPTIRVGSRVKINNADINKAQIGTTFGSEFTAENQFASPAADGIYRVYVAEAYGDSRGNEWYSDLTCLSVDATTDPNNSVLAYG